MIGLYQNLARMRAILAGKRVTAAAVDSDPRIAHDVSVEVLRMAREEKELMTQIQEDVEFMAGIQGLINRITVSPHGSANRTLAIRHLEDAQSRLQRELGDKPLDETCGRNAHAP